MQCAYFRLGVNTDYPRLAPFEAYGSLTHDCIFCILVCYACWVPLCSHKRSPLLFHVVEPKPRHASIEEDRVPAVAAHCVPELELGVGDVIGHAPSDSSFWLEAVSLGAYGA